MPEAGTPRPAGLFAEACSACHSLIGNESLGRQGGDLLRYQFSREVMLEFTREMPVRRPLGAVQLAKVVNYVLEVEQLSRKRPLARGS